MESNKITPLKYHLRPRTSSTMPKRNYSQKRKTSIARTSPNKSKKLKNGKKSIIYNPKVILERYSTQEKTILDENSNESKKASLESDVILDLEKNNSDGAASSFGPSTNGGEGSTVEQNSYPILKNVAEINIETSTVPASPNKSKKLKNRRKSIIYNPKVVLERYSTQEKTILDENSNESGKASSESDVIIDLEKNNSDGIASTFAPSTNGGEESIVEQNSYSALKNVAEINKENGTPEKTVSLVSYDISDLESDLENNNGDDISKNGKEMDSEISSDALGYTTVLPDFFGLGSNDHDATSRRMWKGWSNKNKTTSNKYDFLNSESSVILSQNREHSGAGSATKTKGSAESKALGNNVSSLQSNKKEERNLFETPNKEIPSKSLLKNRNTNTNLEANITTFNKSAHVNFAEINSETELDFSVPSSLLYNSKSKPLSNDARDDTDSSLEEIIPTQNKKRKNMTKDREEHDVYESSSSNFKNKARAAQKQKNKRTLPNMQFGNETVNLENCYGNFPDFGPGVGDKFVKKGSYFKNDLFSAGVFEFPPQIKKTFWTTDNFIYFFVLDGTSEFEIAGSEIILNIGGCCIIPKCTLYSIKNTSNQNNLLVNYLEMNI